MSTQDLTQYTDQELTLIVFNTSHLYFAMRKCTSDSQLTALVAAEFKYTPDQLSELLSDWHADCAERNA